jgi:DNA polymerase-3 subunit alpha
MKVLLIDTETTGLPKKRQSYVVEPNCWPDIVSISWCVYINKVKSSKKTYIIKPKWDIPEDSVKIHGISKERAEREGVPLNRALDELKADLVGVDRVIAHNLDFDKNVILAAYKWRLKTDTFFWPRVGSICSMEKSCPELKLPTKDGIRYKSPSLKELWIDTFKCEPPADAHSADRDVEVLEKICLQRWGELF